MLVACCDGSAESHIYELIEAVESEDVSPGGIPEPELGDFGVGWSVDFAGVDLSAGGGGVVV